MPVESFLLNLLFVISDYWRMKNIRSQNIRSKIINAFGTRQRYLKVEGIQQRMQSFLLVFYQIEMQSMMLEPGQIHRESIYALAEVRNDYSLCGVN